jgi:hypothetical protein
MTPDTFFNGGSRCPICMHRQGADKLFISDEVFKERIKQIHKGHIITNSAYNGNDKKVTITHFDCGRTFDVYAGDLLQGKGGNGKIKGGSGYDKIKGGGGADKIQDGECMDTVDGGKGKDKLRDAKVQTHLCVILKTQLRILIQKKEIQLLAGARLSMKEFPI